jgi:hypothetical protein
MRLQSLALTVGGGNFSPSPPALTLTALPIYFARHGTASNYDLSALYAACINFREVTFESTFLGHPDAVAALLPYASRLRILRLYDRDFSRTLEAFLKSATNLCVLELVWEAEKDGEVHHCGNGFLEHLPPPFAPCASVASTSNPLRCSLSSAIPPAPCDVYPGHHRTSS